MVEAKAELRGRLRAARSARVEQWHSEANQDAAAESVADAVREDEIVAELLGAPGAVAATYRSRRGEPPTDVLNHRLGEAGVGLLFPVCVDDERLGWVPFHEGVVRWVPDARGMLRPDGKLVGVGAEGLIAAGTSVVFVPALAVARDGMRLGQGGGYYDRVLTALPGAAETAGVPRPLSVAIIYASELLESVPADPWDVRVDRWITVPD